MTNTLIQRNRGTVEAASDRGILRTISTAAIVIGVGAFLLFLLQFVS